MESGNTLLNKKGTTNDDVVVTISSEEEGTKQTLDAEISKTLISNDPDVELAELSTLRCRIPTMDKPPKIPETVIRKPALTRSPYSKPKSRMVEQSYVTKIDESTAPRVTNLTSVSGASSPRGNARSNPATPKTPVVAAVSSEDDEDEDEDVYTKEEIVDTGAKSGKKKKFSFFSELAAFVIIMGMLIACLTVGKLRNGELWSLEYWKWCVLVLVIVCGRLFSEWCITILVFLIERNYLLRMKVLYFVYGLKKSVQVFIYLGLVLLAWALLFNKGVARSKDTKKVLDYITRALASCLLGAFIWMIKTLLVKLLASSFHVKRFFDRIQESIFLQYVLQTLSGPPLMEMTYNIARSQSKLSIKSETKTKGKGKEEVINVDKLHKLKQENISPWTMKGLVTVIRSSGLTTLSDSLHDLDDEGNEQKNKQITTEAQAKQAARRIFFNVAKPGNKFIFEDDLLRFMKQEEVDHVLPLFEQGAETKKIKKIALRNWVVNVYNERKALAYSLNDTKTAVEELNRICSGIILIVILIVWLLLMGFATTQVLVLISSQLLLAAFMFGNTCKMVFEAIIFVFIMHPFDVGDRCVIDGVQMVVEEMNILTTIFLRYDNEKIIYPNSVLTTKPISNFYRSPEMSDSVEFCVDVSTSVDTIGALKAKIDAYLKSNSEHWNPKHSVWVKEIEEMNKMKMCLYVTHTINFQNAGERGSRRSDLVIELKRIFEELEIKYHLLPQQVTVNYAESSTTSFPRSTR